MLGRGIPVALGAASNTRLLVWREASSSWDSGRRRTRGRNSLPAGRERRPVGKQRPGLEWEIQQDAGRVQDRPRRERPSCPRRDQQHPRQSSQLSGEVRKQQEQAAESNTGVTLVTTLDLPMGPDGIHFTVNSYKEIGTRFANAWWQLARARAASLVR